MTPPTKAEEPKRAGERKRALKPLRIDEEQAGRRLDNFLLSHFKGVPRSRIYRALQRGEVRVNSARSRPSYRLQVGDQLRLPPLRTPVERKTSPLQLSLAILHEDRDLLAVAKPVGLAVHGGSGLAGGIVESLRQARPDEDYLELAHRLDRDTSGCLLLIKRRAALRQAHKMFRERKVVKRYLALAHGAWPEEDGSIEEPLLERRLNDGIRWSMVDRRGRAARTEVAIRERFLEGEVEECSLLELRPLSGRMHQLRVHLAYRGHPIVGDLRYGDVEADKALGGLGLNRMMLHAQSLQFEWEGRPLLIEAPVTEDFAALLGRLRA